MMSGLIRSSDEIPSECCVETSTRSISTGRWRPCVVDLVADRHLRLPVRPQVRELARLAHLGEPLADLVREHDRKGHQLLRLVRRVAEHHSLVARADAIERIVVARVVLHLVRGVDALRDVRRLLVDRDDDAARRRVEAPLGVRVADLRDALADELRDVDVDLGRDLAGDDDEAGRDQRLAGARVRAGRPRRTASSTESEIWSAILSGWPSVTDSEVKRNSRAPWRGKATGRVYLMRRKKVTWISLRLRGGVLDGGAKRLQVARDFRRNVRAGPAARRRRAHP